MGYREGRGYASKYAAPLELGYSPATRPVPLRKTVPILAGDPSGPLSGLARALTWGREARALARQDAHAVAGDAAERAALDRVLARRDTAASALAIKAQAVYRAISLYVVSFQPDPIDVDARRTDAETLAGAHMDFACARLRQLAGDGRTRRSDARLSKARREITRQLRTSLCSQMDELLDAVAKARRLHLYFRDELREADAHCASVAHIASAVQDRFDRSARTRVKTYLDERGRRERRDVAPASRAPLARPTIRPPSPEPTARNVQAALSRIEQNLGALNILHAWALARRRRLETTTSLLADDASCAGACERLVMGWRADFATRPAAGRRRLPALYRR